MATAEALAEGLTSLLHRVNEPPPDGVHLSEDHCRCHGSTAALWHAAERLLLSPEHAIPASSCLRPFLSRLVGGAIERRARNLSIDARAQRSADESTAIALSLILPSHTHLLTCCLRFFALALPPFGRRLLPSVAESSDLLSSDPDGLLNCLLASLRFLRCSRRFAPLWHWEPVLRLARHPDSRIRWAVAHTASELLCIDSSSALAGVSPELSPSDDVQLSWLWTETEAAIATEKASAFTGSRSKNEHMADGNSAASKMGEPPGEVNVCGFDLTCKPGSNINSGTDHVTLHAKNSFAWIPSVKENMTRLSAALCRNKPVLIRGQLGSGKTALASQIASLTGNTDMLTLNVDDQTDSRSILGGYVCGNGPGDFRWQQGVLTRAVLNGRWLLIEDIDVAPGEVHSLLRPLLHSNKLYIAERGETITAAHGFQLLATAVTGRSSAMKHTSSGLWATVDVESPSPPEMEQMLAETHMLNTRLAHKMVQSILLLQDANGTLPNTYSSYLEHERLPRSLYRGRMRKPFTMRDLNKWATRLVQLHGSNLRGEHHLSNRVLENCFHQGCAILASAVPSYEGYRQVLDCFSRVWSMQGDHINAFVQRAPQVLQSGASVKIGRSSVYLSTHRASMTYGAYSTTDQSGLDTSPAKFNDSIGSSSGQWSNTSHATRMLEELNLCVQFDEPALLVGETGAGKTSLVQQLANLHGAQLSVVNMSQQTDMADLLGGFKPVSAKVLCRPLHRRFHSLFTKTFSTDANAEFLSTVSRLSEKQKWNRMLQAIGKACERALELGAPRSNQRQPDALEEQPRHSVSDESDSAGISKRSKRLSADFKRYWEELSDEVESARRQVESCDADNSPVFAFVEGALVNALRNGDWILLDEINLAPAEALHRLESVLDGQSIILTERGDTEAVVRDRNFKIFACMNPPTDVGKRDLQSSIKARMTEIFVEEPSDRTDLEQLARGCLQGIRDPPIERIVSFFQESKDAARHTLLDSAERAPQYNLRSLVRALVYARSMTPTYGFNRALYDGICMTFLTLLHQDSLQTMNGIIRKHIVGNLPSKELQRVPRKPQNGDHVLFENFWVQTGPHAEPEEDENFVLTNSMREYLQHLARGVVIRKYPILLQGPTGSGKTTLVKYLARRSGHKFVRINNHEHTDIAEYIGTYTSNEYGQLEFEEGALVQAVRHGHWIVLDELNLAPSDVLEALNRNAFALSRIIFLGRIKRAQSAFIISERRLLDDNHELFVPETQETVQPHQDFMLFATQNPPNAYAGRKNLSRAFKSRFLELHVGDFPDEELRTVLQTRSALPPSHCVKMVEIMRELQRRRQGSRVFSGKESFITVRDLLKLAKREPGSMQGLAQDAFMLLSERLRKPYEKEVVLQVLRQKVNIHLDMESLYQQRCDQLLAHYGTDSIREQFAFTQSSKRLFSLLHRALESSEAVLLVGDTGTGKTRVCQLFAELAGKQMHIVNCHQQTETSDLIGGYRPRRQSSTEGGGAPFVWNDGPLVKAMKQGDMLLVDELSLSEDSVIERLNSVLDNHSLALTEKGGSELEVVQAKRGFTLVATMNPSGDFGKKELSPALRNRFTEIWVPPLSTEEEVRSILDVRASGMQPTSLPTEIMELIVRMWSFTANGSEPTSGLRQPLSVRDLITWADFVGEMMQHNFVNIYKAFIHGAHLILLDGAGIGAASSGRGRDTFRQNCEQFLQQILPSFETYVRQAGLPQDDVPPLPSLTDDGAAFGAFPFYIDARSTTANSRRSFQSYEMQAPTTARNVFRVLRAMQLHKPLMIEGLPGVGKTSLVAAIANAAEQSLVRINLSQQTDMMDLIGADVPSEGGDGGQFKWCDGPLLSAIKQGQWVLLDELNLASQTVLEGLNSVLDHRGRIFVPELNQTFSCGTNFRVFAAQNPAGDGSERKSLPKSFLNRFAKVYVQELKADDQKIILSKLHPSIPPHALSLIISTTNELQKATDDGRLGAHGKPHELNLRDAKRWCEIAESVHDGNEWLHSLQRAFSPVLMQRFRSENDRWQAARTFIQLCGSNEDDALMAVRVPECVRVYHDIAQIGYATIPRSPHGRPPAASSADTLLRDWQPQLQALGHCVEQGWLSIVVGETGSGKRTIVRQLASLCGGSLHELSLTAATDTSDMLGSYEQAEPTRKRRALEEEVRSMAMGAAAEQVTSQHHRERNICQGAAPLEQSAIITSALNEYEASVRDESDAPVEARKNQLVHVVSVLSDFVECSQLRERAEGMDASAWSSAIGSEGRFEWVDGLVLQAMERGEWLLLEDANLCSPSVLDRLNPLLEPGGEMLVNEAGLQHGQPRCVRAHSNFRLFLTMDPSHGSLSRAMRNRGVEVVMPSPTADSIGAVSQATCRLPPQTLPAHVTRTVSHQRECSLRSTVEETKRLQMLLERGHHVPELSDSTWGDPWPIFRALLFPQLHDLVRLCERSGAGNALRLAHPLLDVLCDATHKALSVKPTDSVSARSAFFGTMLVTCPTSSSKREPEEVQAEPQGLDELCFQTVMVASRIFVSDCLAEDSSLTRSFLESFMSHFQSCFGLTRGANLQLQCASAALLPELAERRGIQAKTMRAADWWHRVVLGRALEGEALLQECTKALDVMWTSSELSLIAHALTREQSSSERKMRQPTEASLDALPRLLRAAIELELAFVFHSQRKVPEEVVELQRARRWLLLCGLKRSESSLKDREALFVPWLTLRKHIFHLGGLSAVSSCRAECEELLSAAGDVDRCYGMQSGERLADSSILDCWGRPFLPQNASQQERLLQLEKLANRLRDQFPSAASLKWRCAELASALTLPGTDSASSAEIDHAMESLESQAPQVVSSSKVMSSFPELENTPSAQDAKFSFSFEETRWSICSKLQDTLHWLNGERVFRKLEEVCARVCALLAGQNDFSIKETRRCAQEAANESMENTNHRPVHVIPLLQLAWLLEDDEDRSNYRVHVVHNFLYSMHSIRLVEQPGKGFGHGELAPVRELVSSKQHVPACARAAKAKQLKLATRTLRKNALMGNDEGRNCSRRILLLQFAHMLRSLAKRHLDHEKYQRVSVQLEMLAQGCEFDISSLQSVVDMLEDQSTRRILFNLIAHVAALVANEKDEVKVLGFCWCLLGLWRVHTCMTKHATDPVARHKDWANRFREFAQEDLGVELHMVLKRGEALAERDEDVSRSQALRRYISESELEAAAAEAHVVERPYSPSFAELKREVLRACSGLLEMKEVEKILYRLERQEESAHDEAIAWKESALEWSEWLTERFSRLRDICQPIALGVLECTHGIDLVIAACKSNIALKRSAALKRLTAFPQNHSQLLELAPEKLIASDATHGSLFLSALRLRLVRIETSAASGSSSSLWKEAEQTMSEAVSWWSQLQYERGERETEAMSLFRATAYDKMGAPETEKEEEEHYTHTFPRVDQRFFDLEGHNDGTDGKKYVQMQSTSMENAVGEKLSSESNQTTRVSSEDLERHLLDKLLSVSSLLCGRQGLEGESSPSMHAFRESFDFSGICENQTLRGSNEEALASKKMTLGQLARTCLRHASLNTSSAPSSNPDSSGLTFAVSSAPALVEQLSKPVARLLQRVSELLEDFEENPLLQLLQQICERILNVPADAPFKQLLIGVELLLSKARLWERGAAKHVSLEAYLNECLSLAREWRRKEIKSWSSMMDSVEQTFQQRAQRTWFPLFQLLMTYGLSKEQLTCERLREITRALEDYVVSGSAGGFVTRISLLRNFALLLKRKKDAISETNDPGDGITTIRSIVENVCLHYAQLKGFVRDYISRGREPIERELHEHIRLARWEDRTFEEFKAQNESNHRKLHRLWRRMEDVLNQPMTTVLQNVTSVEDDSLKLCGSSSAEDSAEGRDDVESVWVAFRSEAAAEYARSQVASSIGNTERIELGRYSSRLHELLPQYLSTLDEAAKSVPSERAQSDIVDEVRDVVDSRSKDMRKSSGMPKAQKKRCFSDLLRMLPEIGISQRRSDIPAEERDDIASFVEPALLMHDGSSINGAVERAIHAGERSFFNLSVRKRIMADKAKYPSTDLSPAEVDRMTNLCEHVHYLLRLQRRTIRSVVPALDSIERVLDCTSNAARSAEKGLAACSARQKESHEQAQHLQKSTKECLEQLKQMQELYAAYASVEDDSELGEALQNAETTLKSAINEIVKHERSVSTCATRWTNPTLPTNFVAGTDESSISECMATLSILMSQLNERKDLHENVPGWSICVDVISQATKHVHQSACDTDPHFEIGAEGQHARQAVGKLEQAVRSALIWAQRVSRIAPTFAEKDSDHEDDEMNSQPTVSGCTQAFDDLMSSETAMSMPKAAAAAMHHASELEDEDVIVVGEALARFSPLLRVLHGAMQHHLAALAQYYHKTAQLANSMSTAFANLLEEGFGVDDKQQADESQQQPEGKSSGNADRDSEGVGMGEGQGTRDVSEQIENEDQLIGDNAEAEREEHGKEQEGENGQGTRGIEMSQAFEEQEERDITEDDGDENGGAAEEDLEKRFAEGKDENAEALDERMWNQREDRAQEETLEDHQKPEEKNENQKPELRAAENDKSEERSQEQPKQEIEQQLQGESEDRGGKVENGDDGADDESQQEQEQDHQEEHSTGMQRDAEEQNEEQGEDLGDMQLDEEGSNEAPEGDDDQQMEEEGMHDADETDDGMREQEIKERMEHSGEDELDAGANTERSLENRGNSDEQGDSDQSQTNGHCAKQGDASMKVNGNDQERGTGEQRKPREGAYDTQQPSEGAAEQQAQQHDDRQQQDAVMAEQREEGDQDDREACGGLGASVPSRADRALDEDGQKRKDESQAQQTESKESWLGPNPYRSLSDALKAWHRRLNMVGDEPNRNCTDGLQQSNEEEQKADDADEDMPYEFLTQQGREGQSRNYEAIGPATEEQAQAMDHQAFEEEGADAPMGENAHDEEAMEEEMNAGKADRGQHVRRDREGRKGDTDRKLLGSEDEEPSAADERDAMGGEGVTMRVDEMDEMQVIEDVSPQHDSATEREKKKHDQDGASEETWARVESATWPLASELAEELRVVLEPSGRGRLEGDYKTGKRLNMRKVIPYIASGYRKDKIWMRRTRPSERKYQVVLCIDDSKSMQSSGCGELALRSLATVLTAMSTVQVPELSVMRFGHGSEVVTVHELGKAYSAADGPGIVSAFGFKGDNSLEDKPVHALLSELEPMLEQGGEMRQLVLVVGDGHLHEKEEVRAKVRDVNSKSNALLAFVALDGQDESLLNMQKVEFEGERGEPKFRRYMDSFPFPYYVLVQQLESLPQLVSDLLKQWFELSAAS